MSSYDILIVIISFFLGGIFSLQFYLFRLLLDIKYLIKDILNND